MVGDIACQFMLPPGENGEIFSRQDTIKQMLYKLLCCLVVWF